MDTITEALKQFLGEYIVAAAIIVIAFAWFIWWISSKYHSMKSMMDGIDKLPCSDHAEQLQQSKELFARIESKIDGLPVGSHSQLLKEQADKLSSLDSTLARLEGTLDKLHSHDKLLNEQADKLSRTESKLESLPCSSHSEKHYRHEDRLNKTDALLHKMEGQLELLVGNSIVKSSEKIRNKSGLSFSAKHSPRVLNENGISLLHDIGGKEFLDENMDLFISKIESLQPKTALDVENLALAVIQTATIDDMFIPLKNWIYNAPIRTLKNPDGSTTRQEVTLDDVVFVLSLPVRDRYLEIHPL